MGPFKVRLLLIALFSLFLTSACMADGLVVVLDSATTGYDERTGRPVLKLTVTDASREKLRGFAADNVGRKIEYSVEGRTVIAVVIREPMSGKTQTISDSSWTDETVIRLAQEFSKAPDGEIRLRSLPRSN